VIDAVRTTCPYCGVGCGVIVRRLAEGGVDVRGDPEHPANQGRLCSKGTALAATLGTPGRLLNPEVEGRVVDWESALDSVSARLQQCLAEHGPESVALYVSGQMLTEDYYVANKLMKGYIGTANIDTNSRLCMSSAVSGHVRAFGEDVVPVDHADLETCDLLVLVGSNLAWCHPVLMQRVQAARERRPELRVVVIDPRRTPTAQLSDLHLPLRSGTDVMLFNGLLSWLDAQGYADETFVTTHTSGAQETLQAARATSTDVLATAQACGLEPSQLQQFFDWFAATPCVVTAFSQGVNQSSAGVDKVNSIINCHLLTGRIGRAGMGPFSITGQPNAMGGREVGGLSTQLAAHLSLEDEAHRQAVQAFWNAPRMASRPGPKAVELFDSIDEGRIKAVWIMATNPVVSLPDADRVKRALSRCPLVIVSDCVDRNDTLRYAHIKLPAAGWAEKEGTVTNSDRYISRQRAFQPAPGQARPDWWIISAVARRMGFDGFEFSGPAEIFNEHVRLTAISARFGKKFDLTGLAGISEADYGALRPRQWPAPAAELSMPLRPFSDGQFSTVDGRARLAPTPARLPRHAPTAEFPLVLNTGRIRDQWHTMTRTGRAPQLNAHEPEPFVDANPPDLKAAGLVEGELVRVVTRWGSAVGRVRGSGEVPAGMLFMPIHWSEQFAQGSCVGSAVNPVVDPLSGEPEFKHTPARLERVVVQWHGFLLSRQSIAPQKSGWWAISRQEAVNRLEFAGADAMPDAQWLLAAVPGSDAAEWIEYSDPGTGSWRAALLSEGRLRACVMITRTGSLPPRGWLTSLFTKEALEPADRSSLIRGARRDVPDPGPTVCACYHVGANSLLAAVQSGCNTLEAIGTRLRAGTNCGSCRPEILRMLAVAT
jgi:assimilatory nitrate reductase catalytic subunit